MISCVRPTGTRLSKYYGSLFSFFFFLPVIFYERGKKTKKKRSIIDDGEFSPFVQSRCDDGEFGYNLSAKFAIPLVPLKFELIDDDVSLSETLRVLFLLVTKLDYFLYFYSKNLARCDPKTFAHVN